jgi:small conductance mechanosensitive channel
MQIAAPVAEHWVTTAEEYAVKFGLGLLSAAIIMLAGLAVAHLLARAASVAMQRTPLHRRQLLVNFLTRTVRVTVVVFAAVLALGKLGVNLGPLIAGIGITGFVVGFAFKDSLSNLAAGLLLLVYQPFDVGDTVEIGGMTGSVLDMSIVATEMKMPDGRLGIMPNSRVWNAPIINFNRLGARRIEWTVGVGYSADIGAAFTALRSAVDADPRVLKDPAPQYVVDALGDSSVSLVVRAWVGPNDVGDVTSDLRRRMKESLDEHGIEIPYPHRVMVQPKATA